MFAFCAYSFRTIPIDLVDVFEETRLLHVPLQPLQTSKAILGHWGMDDHGGIQTTRTRTHTFSQTAW